MQKRFLHTLRVMLLVFALAGCDADRPNVVATAPKPHQAVALVGEFTIAVSMVQSHPTLGEHDKHVDIRRGGKTLASYTLNDPGGFATVYVIDDGPRLLVIDGLVNGKMVDKESGKAADVEPNSVPGDFAERNLGQFRFIDTSSAYAWVPKAP